MIDPYTEEIITDARDRPVRDIAEVEADAEYVRSRLSPQPVEGMLKTPDEMIDDLEWSKYGTGRIALVLKDAHRTKKAIDRRLAGARAVAMGAATGKSAEQREAEVYLATQKLQAEADEAEVVYEFAKTVGRSVESAASQTQTQAGLVKSQLSLAGTGRQA